MLITNGCYINIWSGKNGNKERSELIGDDTGENISEKNKYFSELTGIYWVWKNYNAQIIGTCHYRRYFTNVKEPLSYRIKRITYYPIGLYKKRFGLIYTNKIDFWKNKVLQENEIGEIFKTYDAIMPLRRKFKYSIKEHYRRYHDLRDLDLIETILKEFYPEYLFSFKKVSKEKRLFANNMFILKNKLFQEMMEWLFHILFEMEKRIELNNYKNYQQRIFGFLSERLITLWIYHNKIKYKELPLIYFKQLKAEM